MLEFLKAGRSGGSPSSSSEELALLAELVLEWILVLAQIRRIIEMGMAKPAGKLESSSPAPFSSERPRKVLDRVEAEIARNCSVQ